MKVLTTIAICLALAACVEVIDATPQGIWIEEPFISIGDPDEVASEHCAQYGRRAVEQGQFGGGDSSFLPIQAYNCE